MSQKIELPEGFDQPGDIFRVVSEILNKEETRDVTKLDAAKILFEEIRYYSQPKSYRDGVEKLQGILFKSDS